jgi:hypothetical protein
VGLPYSDQWGGIGKSESATHYAAMVSSNSGPLFRGEPTRRSIGHTRSSPSGAGRNSAAQSPSASPSHVVQSCWSRITGIRSEGQNDPHDLLSDGIYLLYPLQLVLDQIMGRSDRRAP